MLEPSTTLHFVNALCAGEEHLVKSILTQSLLFHETVIAHSIMQTMKTGEGEGSSSEATYLVQQVASLQEQVADSKGS